LIDFAELRSGWGLELPWLAGLGILRRGLTWLSVLDAVALFLVVFLDVVVQLIVRYMFLVCGFHNVGKQHERYQHRYDGLFLIEF
jgi:hypothetical protein